MEDCPIRYESEELTLRSIYSGLREDLMNEVRFYQNPQRLESFLKVVILSTMSFAAMC